MSTTKLPAARQPVIEIDPESGVNSFTRPWFLFFQFLFQQIGGAGALTTTDLAQGVQSGTEELRAMMNSIAQSQDMRSEINGLREKIAELEKMIGDIQQGTTL